MSYKGEVHVQGEWVSNALRFATAKEAHDYAQDLAMRWTACADWRAEPSEDPVTHEWDAEQGLRDVNREGAEFRMPARSVQL